MDIGPGTGWNFFSTWNDAGDLKHPNCDTNDCDNSIYSISEGNIENCFKMIFRHLIRGEFNDFTRNPQLSFAGWN